MRSILFKIVFFIVIIPGAWSQGVRMDRYKNRDAVILESSSASLVTTIGGGCIVDFHLNRPDALNPLNWSLSDLGTEEPDYSKPEPAGIFICYDRWGSPSPKEAENGMPFHGEASHVFWTVDSVTQEGELGPSLQMSCDLPIAGLALERQVVLDREAPVAFVQEHFDNRNLLGRIYNVVQHCTIGPPFLTGNTIVNCNAGLGFIASDDSWPDVQQTLFMWPKVKLKDGKQVDLRYLEKFFEPGLTSFVVTEEFGWSTAASPEHGLLIGFIWRTSDYPWFNVWRHTKADQPSARAMEFGTTGGHKTFDELVAKKEIMDKPLFEWIDSAERKAKEYMIFLTEIPKDYSGTEKISFSAGDQDTPSPDATGSIVIEEQGTDRAIRIISAVSEQFYCPEIDTP